jgi:RNA polymerase sigma factor (sigma-70 family)
MPAVRAPPCEGTPLADRAPPPATRADLDAWVLADAPDAVAYAASLLRDRSLAEDVVQDCFCRLLAKAATYDLSRDGRKLLFASVTNACLNHNTRCRTVLSLHAGEDSDPGGRFADPTALPPERTATYRELERAVADGLARLPVQLRAALELKSLGHSLQEIAAALGVTANHAGVLVHRARRAMADHLAPFVEERAG